MCSYLVFLNICYHKYSPPFILYSCYLCITSHNHSVVIRHYDICILWNRVHPGNNELYLLICMTTRAHTLQDEQFSTGTRTSSLYLINVCIISKQVRMCSLND